MTAGTRTEHTLTHIENTIQALLEQGQSVWQDDISREMLTSGLLQRQVNEVGIRGLTSNPTIFEKAIAAGHAYDDDVIRLLKEGKSAGEIFEAVAVEDIRNACDLFQSIYEASGGCDGFVSIEVSPTLARDTQASLIEARRLWAAVDRPNLMVKIPGTIDGLPAIEQALEEGLNINITLLFAVARYEQVALAYIAALEKRLAAGRSLDRVASVASFFVSRVDTLVDKILEQKIAATKEATEQARLRNLQGKAAIANAKLAYNRFREIFGGTRFAPLRARGANVQRPLWGSTSTKNPTYRDVLYVEELIGPDTVNTMPRPTIEAFVDHGLVHRTLDRDVDAARQVMGNLAAVGIDMEAVTQQLEEEGIAAFAKSFEELLASVERKRAQMAETVAR